jgi:polyphenol oxidase
MDRTRFDVTRRDILKTAVTGVAGAALTGLLPQAAQATHCNAPASSTAPKPWSGDCRPIRPRRPASTLTAAEIDKLKAAYKALRDLQVSDPNDPRGFQHQANIHCFHCGGGHAGGPQVHGSWLFFAWHRAELYFHERILGHLIGDPDFRLPYWSYDNAAHRKLPPAYVTPNTAANPLFNSTRTLSPTAELPAFLVDQSVFDNLMGLGTFTAFGGSAALSGAGEGTPHGGVHVQVGGDMRAFSTAGRDPIFYAHHGRIDKIWSDWNRLVATHTNPTDFAFLNTSFSFYDENKVWTSIKFWDVLDHENRLRYTYGGPRFILPTHLTRWLTLQRAPQRYAIQPAAGRLQVPPTLATSLRTAVGTGSLVRLDLEQVAVPAGEPGIYLIYADAQSAAQNAGPNSPGYLGYTAVVPNAPGDKVATIPTITLDLTSKVAALTGGLSPYLVKYQPAAGSTAPSAARPVPLAARQFTIAQD